MSLGCPFGLVKYGGTGYCTHSPVVPVCLGGLGKLRCARDGSREVMVACKEGPCSDMVHGIYLFLGGGRK